MDRRQFLTLTSRALLGTALASSLFFPPAAAAQDPATAILIAQTAISVIQLFSQGEGGVGTLLRLQVEMLKAISEKLDAIQLGVLEILKRLDRIEALIGQIPGQVVVELYRAKISGLNGRYSELMSTYKKDLDSRGIEYAQSNNAGELESELLKPLREARDVLMTYRSFGLVPILCCASFVETHAMIMASYRKTRMLEAVHRYQNWLTSVSDGSDESTLAGAIVATRKKLQKDFASVPKSEVYDCVSRLVVVLPGQPSPCNPNPYTGGDFESVTFKPTIEHKIDPQLDTSVDELLKLKILPEDERPAKISVAFSTPVQTFQACGNRVRLPVGKDEAWLNMLLKNQCPDWKKRLADTENLSQHLTEEGVRLVALHSLKHAADEGRTFLTKIKKSLGQLDKQSTRS
jgi:hypothetical protein